MIGHGTLGLRDSIPTFRDITGKSDARGYPLLECGFGVQISSWFFHAGTTWKARANFIIGGILRDVVSVSSSAAIPHTVRTGSLVACEAAAYSFFADTAGARIPLQFWDSGGPPPGWDSWNTFFDEYPPLDLYLNLGGVDPNSVAVIAELGFFYSYRAVRHPVLGPNILGSIWEDEEG